ncbi:PTS sugar transporter subunit IIB [Secundilactobacillus similis]|jgi:PTS system cellobiose-specific IIB component|uniref:PTS sugar transporter subunit IIB n=1 Tax=Secundilactobacillus similis TaxID=414682 RepID=UPI0006D225D4|nr:hypothetical protein [Secundilactobacillus similis]
MTRVLIVCGSGISSELLQQAAERSAEAYHADIEFEATSYLAIKQSGADDADLVLVAPQVSYHYDELTTLHQNVHQIPDDVYGWLNGENLVKFALAELDKNKVAG